MLKTVNAKKLNRYFGTSVLWYEVKSLTLSRSPLHLVTMLSSAHHDAFVSPSRCSRQPVKAKHTTRWDRVEDDEGVREVSRRFADHQDKISFTWFFYSLYFCIFAARNRSAKPNAFHNELLTETWKNCWYLFFWPCFHVHSSSRLPRKTTRDPGAISRTWAW